MRERDFTEVDLRRMLEDAVAWYAGSQDGRFVVLTRHAHRNWVVILEPDCALESVVVITAYPYDEH